jgi:hypothetical protein
MPVTDSSAWHNATRADVTNCGRRIAAEGQEERCAALCTMLSKMVVKADFNQSSRISAFAFRTFVRFRDFVRFCWCVCSHLMTILPHARSAGGRSTEMLATPLCTWIDAVFIYCMRVFAREFVLDYSLTSDRQEATQQNEVNPQRY